MTVSVCVRDCACVLGTARVLQFVFVSQYVSVCVREGACVSMYVRVCLCPTLFVCLCVGECA